jgi:hypothetical protein
VVSSGSSLSSMEPVVPPLIPSNLITDVYVVNASGKSS